MKPKTIIMSISNIAAIIILSGCLERQALFGPSPQRKIMLQSRTFTPKAGIEKQLIEKINTTPRKSVHAVVQFHKKLSLDDHKYLKESGILIQKYLGATTYELSIPRGKAIDKGTLKKNDPLGRNV